MNEMVFSVHLEKLQEGYYLATSHDLPGLVAQGRTINETLEIARDVARKLIESYREHKGKLPPKLKHKIVRSLDVEFCHPEIQTALELLCLIDLNNGVFL